ncbi:MAG TPA: ABC transporter ATP-binding protein [Symbiobacteriaceae bacterium]|nr:ABC transporter ATP-binding protein [Symbiobacteriaceae bacterium]
MRILRRLWPYYRPGWHLVALSFLQIGLASFLGVQSPRIVGWMVDRVLTEGQWKWLVPGAAAVVVLAIIQGGLRYGQRYSMELVSQRVIFEVRSDLYQKLQSLSFGFYDRAQTGELMSRVTADVEAVRQAAGMGLVNGSMHLATVVGIITSMLLMDWRLSLVSLAFLPFLVLALRRFSGLSQKAWKDVQTQTATLSASIQENLAGVRVVRAFSREDEEIVKFERENNKFQTFNLKAIRLMSFWTNFMNFLAALGTVAVLWYGGRRVISGDISIGTLIAFNTYLANLLNPVRMVGWIVSMFTRAGAGLTRIFDLLDTKSDVEERDGAKELGRATGEVVFDHVSFSYQGSDTVLEDINLHVKPGMRVAVLGMTGSGKSSLINLVPRFYDPTTGGVLLDGTDIRDVTLESLRRNIGIVLQETFLFSTTLKENIAYGKPDATMPEIIAAAKAAQIHEFIDSLPDKYETVVGERGVGLSGGQKQRVAIARAILMNTPVLILDESTSAVDIQTERLIQMAMDRVMLNRTSFVIASRLTTVMNADLVVVLEHGRIVETGQHADLIQREGLYKTIYELQLKPAEEAKGVAV